MKLLVLMYHRARAGRHGNSAEMLDAHFQHVAARFANVLPGEPLSAATLNVVLSFDDAYYDFHALVFPLLQKHGLRALLAVVPAVIQERVATSRADRLGQEPAAAFADPARGGFCTWPELREMVASGRVAIAAHGQTHARLDRSHVDLAAEVDQPKALLGEKTGRTVESFVFPYGRCDRRSLAHVRRTYRFAFRIGGAMNRSGAPGLFYRVDADEMAAPASPFSSRRLVAYRARYWWNRLRGR